MRTTAFRSWTLGLGVLAGCASNPPAPAVTPEAPLATTAGPTSAAQASDPATATPAPSSAPTTRRTRVTEFRLEGGALKLPSPVVFETGSDKLSPVSNETLDFVHDYLDAKPIVTLLRIEGHTDDHGGVDAAQALSEKRALAVARWLVAAGVKCERLLPVGFGQTKPLVPNDSPDNKAQNRRIAFVNAAVLGRPIGAMPVNGDGKLAGDPCR